MWLEPIQRELHKDAATTGDGNIQDLFGRYAAGVVQISGSMGVITFRGTVDGVNWTDLACTNMATGATTATATAVGTFKVPVLGLKRFKAEITTHTGGANRVSATGCFVAEDVSIGTV